MYEEFQFHEKSEFVHVKPGFLLNILIVAGFFIFKIFLRKSALISRIFFQETNHQAAMLEEVQDKVVQPHHNCHK